MIKHISIFALFGMVLAGCAVDSASFEEVAEAEQAIGPECGTAAATVQFSSGVNYTPAEQAYTTPGCYKAHVVDITNLSSEFVGRGSLTAGGFYVSWADTVPNDKAGCEGSLMRALLFEKQSTGWKQLADVTKRGGYSPADDVWQAFCLPPKLSFTKEVDANGKLLWELKAGKTYRVAITGRNAANETRKVNLKSEKPI